MRGQHKTGRMTGALTVMVGAVCLLALLSSPALARQDNYNARAASRANGNGIANANCNSALILVCDSASGAPASLPGSIGLGAVLGAVLAGGGLALRRRHGS